ncbi:MAG: hypothetical protein QW707_06310, partial [Candidatus Bathyarchaeia archaeon]
GFHDHWGGAHRWWIGPGDPLPVFLPPGPRSWAYPVPHPGGHLDHCGLPGLPHRLGGGSHSDEPENVRGGAASSAANGVRARSEAVGCFQGSAEAESVSLLL